MEQILLKSILISLAIVGLRIVSSPGMILYILRMPYEWAQKNNPYLTYLLKPIIGCTTCMASVWTIIIELVYFDLSLWTLITTFIVACMNSIFYELYDKLNK